MARHAIRMLITVLLATSGLLALASPAVARVSIVPGAVKGGDTETFAFRFANERTDVRSNRLVLTFPQDTPIAYAEVAAVRGWTARINPRTLSTPIRIGDQNISQVVGSIVFEGGSVGPRQFEQFNVTMGPLPGSGKLAFAVEQSYVDGRVESWSGTSAAVITFTGGVAAPDAPVKTLAANGNVPGDAVAAEPAAPSDSGGGLPPLALLWGVLGLAIIAVAVVGIRARLRTRTTKPEVSEVVSK
ncbi:DUF1775 domain-containing protein [Amycolatopsis pithecellobii]|uniref:DUF1775 domain-containing protein n=1 Tax=Amycolatopsis pithecellobii TaxID=664692 RepID=A0A6N7YTI6_9PSEU|nr:DUF1775 domain-containing protein [Amycolatopsis pithecellobii]MTD56347.1 DUF1775 domain-containing protein [Amycolatopsis pithecellobii]